MKRARASVLAFGIYLALAGAILVVFPQPVSNLAGISCQDCTVVVRLLGMLVMICSVYYIYSALKGLSTFFGLTIATRLLALPVLFLVVVADGADWKLLLFWIPDGIGAIWTIAALVQDKKGNGG